ncbi:helix-turn-helix domain-containing protein [Vibrio nigripulchritudo]|uniref:helix-turn-helix domain-containing protein n=1 Tax=Vibrio nigripulchritudo TaxID=28173 RepID=UPI0012D3631A
MLIPMSDRDINRFKVLQDVRERRLRQVDAADILNISPRQVRRLLSQHGAIPPLYKVSFHIISITKSAYPAKIFSPKQLIHSSQVCGRPYVLVNILLSFLLSFLFK